MSSTTIGLITAGCTFSGALIGVWLQRRLPRHHLDKDSQEVVKLGAGMIATITALVLGLLVSSAKGTFDTINDGIKQSSAKLILLDRILAQYGPEAQGIRDQMKRSLTASLEAARLRKLAGAPEPAAVQFTNRVEGVQSLLRVLTPQTDGQRQLLAQAQQIAGDMSQTRWLLMEEAQNDTPGSAARHPGLLAHRPFRQLRPLHAAQCHGALRALRVRLFGVRRGVPHPGDEPSAGRDDQGFQRASAQRIGASGPLTRSVRRT